FYRIPHIWHVHEIIENPKIIANIYPKIVSFFSDLIVFNSKATQLNYTKRKKNLEKKSKIIYNGQQRDTKKISKDEITNIRKNYFKINDENVIAIGLVGRINKLKGHTLLADAFSEVLKKYNNIKLIFIGSPPP